MFIRHTAAVLLVDAQMALRSGSWIVNEARNPEAAIQELEKISTSPASDEAITEVVDRLYAIMGEAQMAGELMTNGFEQFHLSDIHPEQIIDTVEPVAIAANDSQQLRKAA